ncbi:hypothetical protein B0H11DRAFT_1898624 [Mycena galericulata]|nr:hypothetical protein B0H11DRAFT_1898624 [Mycena galericulata]
MAVNADADGSVASAFGKEMSCQGIYWADLLRGCSSYFISASRILGTRAVGGYSVETVELKYRFCYLFGASSMVITERTIVHKEDSSERTISGWHTKTRQIRKRDLVKQQAMGKDASNFTIQPSRPGRKSPDNKRLEPSDAGAGQGSPTESDGRLAQAVGDVKVVTQAEAARAEKAHPRHPLGYYVGPS